MTSRKAGTVARSSSAVTSTSALIRGRPHTVTAWAPKRYQRAPKPRNTPSSAARRSTMEVRSDKAELPRDLLMRAQVIQSLVLGGPARPRRLRVTPQSLGEAQRLVRRHRALLGCPELRFEPLDEVPASMGKLLK